MGLCIGTEACSAETHHPSCPRSPVYVYEKPRRLVYEEPDFDQVAGSPPLWFLVTIIALVVILCAGVILMVKG